MVIVNGYLKWALNGFLMVILNEYNKHLSLLVWVSKAIGINID
jgi:hypothetical protein